MKLVIREQGSGRYWTGTKWSYAPAHAKRFESQEACEAAVCVMRLTNVEFVNDPIGSKW